jgi:hypothetical protein
VTYAQRVAVARLLYLIAEKNLRLGCCRCRAPVERFVDERIQKAMDDVERALAED